MFIQVLEGDNASVKIDNLEAYNHRLASKPRRELCSSLEALKGSSSCHWSPKELSKLIILTLKWLWAELKVSHYQFLCHFLSLHGSSFLICFPTNRAYFFKYVFLLHSIIPVSSDLIGRYFTISILLSILSVEISNQLIKVTIPGTF